MKPTNFVLASLCLAALPLGAGAQTQQKLTVGQLFDRLEAGNADLRALEAGVETAGHAVDEAKSRRLPDIDMSLSVSYIGNVLMTDRDFSDAQGFSSPHFGNSFALEARQTVYAGGALDAGIRLAEVRKRQAENGVELTRDQQRFLAVGRLLELYKLDNGIKVYESNIELTQRLIADIKAKQAEGMALQNDVTRYELQMESLKLGLRKLQDSRAVLNHQLCHSIGLADGTSIVPDIAPDAEAADCGASPADWQARAAATSPLLRKAALEVSAADEQVTLAKSDLRPKVAVIAADNFNGPFTYDLPPVDKNINVWYVGVGVSYPLSSLFKSNKSVRRAKAAFAQTRADSAVVAESVDNAMQEAYTLYRQSFVELQTQQKSVELAQQNYRVMNERYLNQLALVTDMVDASNLKLNAELQEANARVGIVYAYYKLKYTAGEI